MISVVIPALNEEAHLRATVQTILNARSRTGIDQLEIIIVNDGSTDRTEEVIQNLKKECTFIRSIFHASNKGLAASFLDALKIAQYDKITIFPGDNYSTPYLVENLFSNLNRADFLISYTMNTELRSRRRNTLSTFFCLAYMLAFDIHVKYINGSPVYPTKILRSMPLSARGYSIFAEINVKLLRKGLTYFEVDGYMNAEGTKSSAIRLKNFLQVGYSFLILFYEIHFKFRKEYSYRSKRIPV